jgi:hypothetical protein
VNATTATLTAPQAAPSFTPKARRAWAFLEAHEQRMAELYGGLREVYCGACGALMGEYLEPVKLFVQRCHACRVMQKFTTMKVDDAPR